MEKQPDLGRPEFVAVEQRGRKGKDEGEENADEVASLTRARSYSSRNVMKWRTTIRPKRKSFAKYEGNLSLRRKGEGRYQATLAHGPPAPRDPGIRQPARGTRGKPNAPYQTASRAGPN